MAHSPPHTMYSKNPLAQCATNSCQHSCITRKPVPSSLSSPSSRRNSDSLCSTSSFFSIRIRYSFGVFLAQFILCSTLSLSALVSARDVELDVIYGDDDRIEAIDAIASGPSEYAALDAATATLDYWQFMSFDRGRNVYRWEYSAFHTRTRINGQAVDFCDGEPFIGQKTRGFCSAFLVTKTQVATAAHCVDGEFNCNQLAIIFDFKIDDTGDTSDELPRDNVYFCEEIVDRFHYYERTNFIFDYVVINLDRPVVGRDPVEFVRQGMATNGEPVINVGHPASLPTKFGLNGSVRPSTPDLNGRPTFATDIDAFSGSSGSMIVNANNFIVEGILVAGNPDYTLSGGCAQLQTCSQSNGCPTAGGNFPFEIVARSHTFEHYVDTFQGLQVRPTGRRMLVAPLDSTGSAQQIEVRLVNSRTDSAVEWSAFANVHPSISLESVEGSVPASSAATLIVNVQGGFTGQDFGEITITDESLSHQRNLAIGFSHTSLDIGQTFLANGYRWPLHPDDLNPPLSLPLSTLGEARIAPFHGCEVFDEFPTVVFTLEVQEAFQLTVDTLSTESVTTDTLLVVQTDLSARNVMYECSDDSPTAALTGEIDLRSYIEDFSVVPGERYHIFVAARQGTQVDLRLSVYTPLDRDAILGAAPRLSSGVPTLLLSCAMSVCLSLFNFS